MLKQTVFSLGSLHFTLAFYSDCKLDFTTAEGHVQSLYFAIMKMTKGPIGYFVLMGPFLIGMAKS